MFWPIKSQIFLSNFIRQDSLRCLSHRPLTYDFSYVNYQPIAAHSTFTPCFLNEISSILIGTNCDLGLFEAIASKRSTHDHGGKTQRKLEAHTNGGKKND
jgi:hypothetical protein